MMKLIIFTLLFNTTLAFSSEISIYKFGNMHVAFSTVEGFIINQSCLNKKCLAFKKAKEFKDQNVPSEFLLGGKNPSAVKCADLMDGRVVKGYDSSRNEQTFCYFEDESFLKN
jgi:hypothetical protein